MPESECVFCPESMDSKLFIYDGFGKLSWILSHQFKPAFENQLVITPKRHLVDILDLTRKEMEDLRTIIDDRILPFFKPEEFVFFLYKIIGRTKDHIHIHGIMQVPDGFQNLPKPRYFVSHAEMKEREWELPIFLFDELAGEDYTTVWTKEGISLYLRKEDDGLFQRSERERKLGYSYEQACKWAEELRRQFHERFKKESHYGNDMYKALTWGALTS